MSGFYFARSIVGPADLGPIAKWSSPPNTEIFGGYVHEKEVVVYGVIGGVAGVVKFTKAPVTDTIDPAVVASVAHFPIPPECQADGTATRVLVTELAGETFWFAAWTNCGTQSARLYRGTSGAFEFVDEGAANSAAFKIEHYARVGDTDFLFSSDNQTTVYRFGTSAAGLVPHPLSLGTPQQLTIPWGVTRIPVQDRYLILAATSDAAAVLPINLRGGVLSKDQLPNLALQAGDLLPQITTYNEEGEVTGWTVPTANIETIVGGGAFGKYARFNVFGTNGVPRILGQVMASASGSVEFLGGGAVHHGADAISGAWGQIDGVVHTVHGQVLSCR